MRGLTGVRRAISATLIVAAVASVPAQAQAGGDVAPTVTNAGGASFDVSAFIGGYEDPTGMWENPCDEPFTYTSGWAIGGSDIRAVLRDRPDGVREVLWRVTCEDPATREISYFEEFWVPLPTPSDIVPDVAALLPGYLDPPVVSWPNASPDHGWLFVKVPMDFRIGNLGPVTVTATVSNSLGTATASATATPSVVVFDSGEGGGAECGFAAATEAYVPRVPGACAYTYQNSSSIAGGEFGTVTTVRWDVSSTPVDPSIPDLLETFTSQSLAVSEVQALVSCQGSGC